MRKKLALVVEDNLMNRGMLVDFLCEEYEILEAGDGEEAINLVDKYKNDLKVVLLDLMMPKIDGFGVLDYMKGKGLLKNIPVLVITSETEADVQLKCLSHGALDFIPKPFFNEIVRLRTKNAVDLYDIKMNLQQRVEEQTREITLQNIKLENVAYDVISLLGKTVEFRDQESGEHVIRVRRYTQILADAMAEKYPEYDLDSKTRQIIATVSVLHDMGKVGIPDAILCKPGKLTADEFEEMKKHTVMGYDMISELSEVLDSDYREYALYISRSHHEKWDGRGYPDGLKEDEIPISAQIVGLADVYDALSSKRVYKDAYGKEKVYEMIINGECGLFNPKLMDTFTTVRYQMEEVRG